jgi:hypothetical protein
MTRALLCLLVVAGCGQGGGAPAVTVAADTTATPTLSFGADWSVTQSGPVVAGGQAVVHYDLARLPGCRASYAGSPAWDIEAFWSVDGGVAYDQPVTALVGGQRVGADITIDVPPGRDLALWFHASDEGGCDEWDSSYGHNFHFALQPGAPIVRFDWPDWSDAVAGTLAAGGDLIVDYDIRRLPFCRQDYNGLQTWDVTVGYRFDGGAAAQASLTRVVGGGQRVQAPARLSAPAGARTLELWFENSDRTGCDRWDSAYGANYAFSLR